MWAVLVVNDQRSIGNCLNLLEVGEQMCIKNFGAMSAIEPLDEGILIGFARLDIADRNAFGCGPLGKGVGDHLRAVVQAYCVGKPIAIDQAAQYANQARRRNGHAYLDGQAFPIGFVDHVQRSESSAAIERVLVQMRVLASCSTPPAIGRQSDKRA